MNSPPLTDDLRRLINSIASVPQLEAMLLFHHHPERIWDVDELAQRLYLPKSHAAKILLDLQTSGICKAIAENPDQYLYAPAFAELTGLINQLDIYYSANLIKVTNMIHSTATSGQKAQLFADAFKFKKDK